MATGEYFIRINLQQRRLFLYQGEQLNGSYPIAIGKATTPSPVGKWRVINKTVRKGGTVFGTRWMGLSLDTYGIHGNNNPSSIGKAVSLGCIRMYNQDVESIYPLIPIGTEVEISSGSQGSGYPLPPYHPPSNPGTPANNPGTPPNNKIHVVKQGETLWKISNLYGVSIADIQKKNPGMDPNLIFPGQVILLP